MARMDLSALQTEVKLFIKGKENDSIKGAANYIIRQLNKEGFTFSRVRSAFTTTAPVSITDCGATKGSVSITGTGLVADMAGQFIQIEGSDVWYPISTASTGSATLEAAFDGDGDSGAGTLSATVAYGRIQLPGSILIPKQIVRRNYSPLEPMNMDIDLFGGTFQSTGEPTHFMNVEEINTSSNSEILILPFPDAVKTYNIVGLSALTRFTTSASTCGIPEVDEDVLISGTMWLCWAGENDEQRAVFWLGEYNRALRRMKAVHKEPSPAPRRSVTMGGDHQRVERYTES